MANRGVKPKPAGLRLVDGTHTNHRHGEIDEVKSNLLKSEQAFGKLVMPSHLKRHGKQAWTDYIDPAWWLDRSREVSAIAFCELWQEFRLSPSGFTASKHAQLRAYMAELGLTDERNRKPAKDNSEDDEFA